MLRLSAIASWKKQRIEYYKIMMNKSRASLLQVIKGIVTSVPMLYRLLEFIVQVRRIGVKYPGGFGSFIEHITGRFADSVAVKEQNGNKITYGELAERINRYAKVFGSSGIGREDVVQIIIHNRVELLVCVAALCRLGAVCALTNPEFSGKLLSDIVNASNPTYFIVDNDIPEDTVKQLHRRNMKGFCVGNNGTAALSNGLINVDKEAEKTFDKTVPLQFISLSKPAILIPTSGTTGTVPKYAIVTHSRIIMSALWFGRVAMLIGRKDTVYCPLPLFHIFGLVVGWPSTIINGSAFALRKKFSVTKFRSDIKKYNATVMLYVGELLSYLLNKDEEGSFKSSLKLLIGNGLRSELWETVKIKYHLRRITEMYGSSESPVVFTNIFNLRRTTGISFDPYAIVEYDKDSLTIKRNRNGYARRVPVGNEGLLLVKISRQRYMAGYTDRAATEKRLVRSVFQRGDCWFDCGDLMMNLGFGHTRFIDRVEGCFRFQGENIVAAMIEVVVTDYKHISNAVCFGIKLPNIDGRVCMAVVQVSPDIRTLPKDSFAAYLFSRLPLYAVPRILRETDSIDISSTFKYKKNRFQKEGITVDTVKDPLWVLSENRKRYVRLSKEIYRRIASGSYQF
jgi:acyl-CoA synthetase (AMP-forming)/AMP-acid ligase II